MKRKRVLMTSGELAKQFHITPQMVHVYATMGLIRARRRTPAGYRLWGPEAIRKLRLVREKNRQGWSLREIAQVYFKG